jgi:hypothetical protein
VALVAAAGCAGIVGLEPPEFVEGPSGGDGGADGPGDVDVTPDGRDAASDAADVIKPDVAYLGCSAQGQRLLAYWPLDEDGGSVITDCSGNGGNGLQGTLMGGTRVAGLFGNVLLFNADGYVDFGNPAALRVTGALTVVAWVNVQSFAGNGRVLAKGGDPTDRGWSLNVESTGNVAAFQIGYLDDAGMVQALAANSDGAVTTGWKHFAGVFEPGVGLHIYVNGVLVGDERTAVLAQRVATTNVNLGRRPDGTGSWRGLIDDVRVFGRVLQPSEILALASQ